MLNDGQGLSEVPYELVSGPLSLMTEDISDSRQSTGSKEVT